MARIITLFVWVPWTMNPPITTLSPVCTKARVEMLLSRDKTENGCAQYLLPLGTRCRSLFKMDFSEALYISELRSGAAGHFSYRRVAWEMYRAIAVKHPALAEMFRVKDVNQPVDLLKR